MHRLAFAALLVALSPCALAAADAAHARTVELQELLRNPKLVGQVVEVVTCAGIPLSDAPHPEDVVLLYPCDQEPSEDTGIVGVMTAATTVKRPRNWGSGDSNVFKGRFRGVLRWKVFESYGHKEKLLALELASIEIESFVDH